MEVVVMGNSIDMQTGKVELKEHDTYEDATRIAYGEAANTGGWTFPVVIFRQGKRMFLSGAFPINFIESRLYSKSVEKGSGVKSALLSMNRPLEPSHTKSISAYITENIKGKYIMPPLTLNIQDNISLHTIKSGPSFKAGYIVIPAGVNLSITDGQHRVKGIIQAIEQLSMHDIKLANRLRNDSISVMITCEHDLQQIHQDFADCSKTKPLPASLLSLYDTRNPANRLVFDLEQNCPLFKGRIDSTSKTLSKKSVYLFLANQLRQMVKHLMLKGNPNDAEFEKRAKERLKEDIQYDKYITMYIDFINCITELIPVLKQISLIPNDSPQKGQIPKFREGGWVCLTATGLNILGSLGYDLFTHGIQDWKGVVKNIVDIDWRRDGEIWQGNIIQGGRLVTQTSPVRKAVEALEEKIGFNVKGLEHSEFFLGGASQ
jgi:DNA sulfur modification protein DndB